jgi:hypothetical protein
MKRASSALGKRSAQGFVFRHPIDKKSTLLSVSDSSCLRKSRVRIGENRQSIAMPAKKRQSGLHPD